MARWLESLSIWAPAPQHAGSNLWHVYGEEYETLWPQSGSHGSFPLLYHLHTILPFIFALMPAKIDLSQKAASAWWPTKMSIFYIQWSTWNAVRLEWKRVDISDIRCHCTTGVIRYFLAMVGCMLSTLSSHFKSFLEFSSSVQWSCQTPTVFIMSHAPQLATFSQSEQWLLCQLSERQIILFRAMPTGELFYRAPMA
jgi:hypothetical protein